MFTLLINELVASWQDYRARGTTSKNHRVHKLVVQEIPTILKSWTPNPSKYIFDGSDGKGNILRAPWFATLNLEVTDSATKGYYLVYLLSEDLKTLVLELGFGAFQFEKQYGRGKKVFEALEVAVANMRLNTEHLLAKTLSATRSRTNVGAVELDKSGDFHLRVYEKCAIYSISYEIASLPPDEDMKRDYLEYLKLYDRMSESLLLADVDSYVYETIDEPKIKEEVTIEEFVPRVFKTRSIKAKQDANSGTRRHSKKSDKVGKLGEQIVFEYEKRKLIKEGRSDLAERVNWHREDSTNRTPGWDITSYDSSGQELFIEVKASEGSKISDVELTINEWVQAEKHINSEKYQVYLVSDVFGSASIQIIRDPAKLVSEGQLTLSIVRYQLLLGARESI
jgi:hypothetical protein